MPTVRVNISDDKFKIPCDMNPEAEQKNVRGKEGPNVPKNKCEKVRAVISKAIILEGTNIETPEKAVQNQDSSESGKIVQSAEVA